MPKSVKNNPVTVGKRKEVDAAANNESGPPKKKYRYECKAEGCTKHVVSGGVCIKHGATVKRCSAEGCTKYAKVGGVCIQHGAKVKRCSSEGCTKKAINGGVCVKHGAKVKRCSAEGCTKYPQKGGVCIQHGAKVKYKRCSAEGCTKQAQRGGVCIKHGAYSNSASTPKASGFGGYCGKLHSQQQQRRQQQQQTITGAASASHPLNYPHHYPQQQWNNPYYHNNPFLYSNLTHPCSIEECNAPAASYGGYCWMHGSQLAALLAQANIQHGHIQDGGNQNNVPVVEILSDDDEAGGKKLPPIAHRKRLEGSGIQQKTGTSSDAGKTDESELKIAENKEALPEKVNPNRSAVGGEGNPKDDEEQDKSDKAYSESLLCQVIQGGGNQENNLSTAVAEISDNEGEGAKKQHPTAARKRKAKGQEVRDVSEPTRRSKQLSTLGRKPNDNENISYPESGGNDLEEEEKDREEEEEVVNSERDTTSDLGPMGEGKGNLKDDGEEDTSSDVAQTQEGEGGPTEAMGDSDHWGDDCQNEFNFESEDNGDANSEEGKHSHVVPEEITTTANDVGKERELQRLTSELNGSKKQVVNLEEQLKAVKSQSKSECEQLQSRLKQVEAQHEKNFQVAAELKEENIKLGETVVNLEEQLKAVKSQSKSECEELQSRLKQVEAQHEKNFQVAAELKEENRKLGETVVNLEEQLKAVKSQSKSEYEQLQSRLKQAEAQNEKNFQMAAELEEELVAQRAQKDDLDSQLMNAATAGLKAKKDKDAVNRKLGGMEEANFLLEDQKKKLTDELCGAKAQLEAKSDTVAKLNAEVALQSSKEKEITDELQEVGKDLEKERSLLWNVRQELKRMFAKLCGTKSELKAKSDSEAEMKRKIDELTEQNLSLRDQLEKQSEGGSAVKEEELTDDEDIATRWKERGTGRDPINEMIMNQKVDFAVSEAHKREVELEQALDEKEEALAERDEALAEREEALAETEELRRQLRFKVKNSPRVRRHDSLTKLSDDRER